MSMFARRNVAAEVEAIDDHNERRRVVPLERDGLPRVSSLPAALNEAQAHADALRTAAEMEPYVPVKHQQPQPTDLEQIALWVRYLIYTDMKQYARGVLGPDATEDEVRALADKFEAWAARTLAPTEVAQ